MGLKQHQQIALCQAGDDNWFVRARIRPSYWPFWSEWRWVVLDFARLQGRAKREKVIGDSRQKAQQVYERCLESGVVPDDDGYFLVAEESEVIEKEND